MIEQDVSLASLIPKDCKVVKIQCARLCHLYQISTEETTLVQVRSCSLLRSGHLWQEMWQLFCSGYMAVVYSHLWAGASWEEESSGVPQDTVLAAVLQCNDLEDGVEGEGIRQFKTGRELWILERTGIHPVLSGDVG